MKTLLFIITATILCFVVFLLLNAELAKVPEISISSFEECVSAGHPVLESYPQQCIVPDNGKTFVEDIGNELEKIDLIQVETPRPNQTISSPLVVKGKARGAWFFEADFPISLADSKGRLIGSAVATAQADWMTEEFVPFEARLEFKNPQEEKGTLIFKKDNPSGLVEHDDELIMPVKF